VSSDDEDAEQLPMNEDEVEESIKDDLEVVVSVNGGDINEKNMQMMNWTTTTRTLASKY
jgi:hypothetical protein